MKFSPFGWRQKGRSIRSLREGAAHRHRPREAASRPPQSGERLEQRQMLAFDFVAAFATDAEPFFVNGAENQDLTLRQSPQELRLRFSPGVVIDPATLDAITVTRSGRAEDPFGEGSFQDQPVPIGSIIVGDIPNQNEVILRFAEALPDDSYRIDIGEGLETTAGEPVEPASFDIRVDLGAKVVSVVPQPVTRTQNGGLSQAENTIAVYFNANDPLDPAFATLASNYRLFDADNPNDAGLTPQAVAYDNVIGRVDLTFANNDLSAEKLYRLQIGNNGQVAAAVDTSFKEQETVGGVAFNDANSSFGTARPLGQLGSTEATVTGALDVQLNVPTPVGNLQFPTQPGSVDEPGHRDISVNLDGTIINTGENHGLPTAGASNAGSVAVRAYNFKSLYGIGTQGQQLFNAISEAQKQRTREVFELYSRYTGIRFVETASDGITVVTGDMRAIDPDIITTPDGLTGPTAFGTAAIMDATNNWGSSEYGGAWFREAMEQIGHALGLSNSFDVPSIMGAGLPGEPVFPGDYDILHAEMLYPASGSDIDIYRFSLPSAGRLTAETVVARPGQPILSKADTVLTLYRETTDNNNVTTREMIARNDDYYGRDAFLGLDLEAGDYYVAVTSTGNTNFNPEIENSGAGGRTDGAYELRLNFAAAPAANATIPDTSGSPLDGDRDGAAGGVFNFWFRTGDTVFVDKAATAVATTGSPTRGSTALPVTSTAGLETGMRVSGNGIAPGTTITVDGGQVTLSQAATATRFGTPLTFGGTLAKPFRTIAAALAAAAPNDIVRIVGNENNTPYQVGLSTSNAPLEDGATFNVPAGVTVMIDEGAILKLSRAAIDVGSSAAGVSRAGATLQVLGVPKADRSGDVIFTSYHDDSIGGNSNGVGPAVQAGQWGGIVLRQDSDVASKRAFVNSIVHADIRYGGGQVVVDSQPQSFAPIHLETTRPTIAFNRITSNALAAISANPNSFEESVGRVGPEIHGNFISENSLNGLFLRIKTNAGSPIDRLDVPARFQSTDITYIVSENLLISGGAGGYVDVAIATLRGNLVSTQNTVTLPSVAGLAPGMRVTGPGVPDGTAIDTIIGNDVTLTQNFTRTQSQASLTFYQEQARASGRLTIDPGVVVKLDRSRIELERGVSQLYAEGTIGSRVVFTGLTDSRFGAGGTFDTNGGQPNKFDPFGRPIDPAGTVISAPSVGEWGGIVLNAGAKASIDNAYIAFGGGTTPIEGNFDNFNVIEVHQGDLRLANSRVEHSGNGLAATDRTGRQGNAAATVFVRGAQPVIVGNDFRNNIGAAGAENAMISINANAMTDQGLADPGRSTGQLGRLAQFDGNVGPLVRGNRVSYAAGQQAIVGLAVRGEEITVESVWDDTDVVHVLRDEIVVNNFHTATGLRLQSQSNASLVVKLLGAAAGFTASGVALDIDDRIGGTVQVVGQPGYPVVLTSLNDDSIGASLNPLGLTHTDTNADGTAGTDAGAQAAAPGDWRSLRFEPLSNDRNVAIVVEHELTITGGIDQNSAVVDGLGPTNAETLGVLAPNFAEENAQGAMNSWESAQEKSGDESRRLGFEVHGSIAFDNPADADIYSFTGYAGSEVWIDVDNTSPSLDAMVELLDAGGNVLARSADSLNDIGAVRGGELTELPGGQAVVEGAEQAITGVAAQAIGVAAQVVGVEQNVTGVAALATGVVAQTVGVKQSVSGVAALATGVVARVVGTTATPLGLAGQVVGTTAQITAVGTLVNGAVANNATVIVDDISVVRQGATVSNAAGAVIGVVQTVTTGNSSFTLATPVTLADNEVIAINFQGGGQRTSKYVVLNDPAAARNGVPFTVGNTSGTVANVTANSSIVELGQSVTVSQNAVIGFGFTGTTFTVDDVDADAIPDNVAVFQYDPDTGTMVDTGVVVQSVNPDDNTVTVSGPITVAAGERLGFSFFGNTVVTTNKIRLASTVGIVAGSRLILNGTDTGLTVDGIDTDRGVITLTNPLAVDNNDTLSFSSNTTTVTIDTAGFNNALGNAAISVNGEIVQGVIVQSIAGSTVTVSGGTLDVADGDYVGFAIGANQVTTNRIRIDGSIDPTQGPSIGASVSINGGAEVGTVGGFDPTSGTVTLAGGATVAIDGDDMVGFSFTGPVNATRVRVADLTGINVGVLVNGVAGVPAGTRVVSVTPDAAGSGGTIELDSDPVAAGSQPVSVANGNTLGFGSRATTVTIDTAGFSNALGNAAISVNGEIVQGVIVQSIAGSTVTVSGGTLDVADGDYVGFAIGANQVTTNRIRIDGSIDPTQGPSIGASVSINGGAEVGTVGGFDPTSGTVTLAGGATVAIDGDDMVGFSFTGPVNATRVRVADLTGINVGVLVNGVAGVPAGTRVVSVTPDAAGSGGTIELDSDPVAAGSQPVSVANGNTLGFGSRATTVTIDTAGFIGELVGAAISVNGVGTTRTVGSIVAATGTTATVNVLGGLLDVADGDYVGFAIGANQLTTNQIRIDNSVNPLATSQVSVNGVATGFTVQSFDPTSRTVTLNGGATVAVDGDDMVGFSFAGQINTARVRVADLTGINTGVLVNGVAGVPAGTRVVSVTPDAGGALGGTIELDSDPVAAGSQPVSVSNGDALGFGFNSANGVTVVVANAATIAVAGNGGGIGVEPGTTFVNNHPNANSLDFVQAVGAVPGVFFDVEDGGELFFGTRQFQLVDEFGNPQGNILPGTLSGVVYLDNTAIQTFTVDRGGVFTFTPVGDPASKVVGGVGAAGSVASLDRATGIVTLPFDSVPAGTVQIEAAYEYSRLSLETLGFTPTGDNGAFGLGKDVYRGADMYSTNPRNPGMRVILPGVVGAENKYYVRVRSQSEYSTVPTAATNPALYEAMLEDPNGRSSGHYELRLRLRQQDEKPGSTVSYADLRYPQVGIDVIGLPRNSQLVGETGEMAAPNQFFSQSQPLGNLLATDRNTISVAGTMTDESDIDWYTFTVDFTDIDRINGVNDVAKTWATMFDIDYADGFKGDLTISVFDAGGRLIYIGRDSNIADDQPAENQGNDFDDLSRGSIGVLDPYIGSVHLPAGAPGASTRYYVAISSNERLPTVLNATFQADAANPLIRLEPVSSVRRIVEDHIGFTGYGSLATNVIPVAGQIIDTTSPMTLTANVRPFTWDDLTVFVATTGGLQAINPFTGQADAVPTSYGTNWRDFNVGDMDMLTDGTLVAYGRNGGGIGTVFNVNAADGSRAVRWTDGIDDDGSGNPTPNDNVWRVTDPIFDALVIGRSGVAAYNATLNGATGSATYYSIQDDEWFGADDLDGLPLTGTRSVIYGANSAGSAAMSIASPRAHGFGRMGYVPTGHNLGNFFPNNNNRNTTIEGVTTGLQFRSENKDVDRLYAVSSRGQFFRIEPRSAAGSPGAAGGAENVVGTFNDPLVIHDARDFSALLPAGETLQGLATAPVNLEGGRYAGMFMAITNTGRVFIIDPDGAGARNAAVVDNLFDTDGDGVGDSWISAGSLTGVTGLAVSPLDINLWHPTEQRDGDAGHQTFFAPDNTRPLVPVNGGLSMYFGLDGHGETDDFVRYSGQTGQFGTSSFAAYNWQQELTAGLGANNYNMPGGARGSLVTHSFSLAGYGYADKPTLYFNYYLETQDANSSELGDSMRDSARVFASRDAGLTWELLATNNSVKSGLDGWAPRGELPPSLSASSRIGDPATWGADGAGGFAPQPTQQVQELFDNTGSWRQARVDLGEFAGVSDIKLRFDFSTGGDFNRTASADNAVNAPSVVRSVTSAALATGNPNEFTFQISSPTGIQSGMRVQRWWDGFGNGNQVIDPGVAVAGGPNGRIRDVAEQTAIVTDIQTVGGVTTITVTGASGNVSFNLGEEVAFFPDRTGHNDHNILGLAQYVGDGESVAARSSNNAFEGFYIDDIIVGFAERGEMVTSAAPGQDFFDVGTPTGSFDYPEQVLEGEYQLEIRRGTEYALIDTSTTPSRSDAEIQQVFDTNDRLITAPAGPELVLEENAFTAIGGAVTTLGNGQITDALGFIRLEGNGNAQTAANAVFWSIDLAGQPTAFLEIEYATGWQESLTPLPEIFVNQPGQGSLAAGDGIAVSLDYGVNWITVAQLTGTRAEWRTVRVDLVAALDRALGPSLPGQSRLTNQTVIGFFQAGTQTWNFGDGLQLRNAVITAAPRTQNVGLVGDTNHLRQQGRFLIENNFIMDAELYGVRIDAGRDVGLQSIHPGVARHLPTLNYGRLAPGVVVMNNVIAGSGTAGVLFSGDSNAAGNAAPLATVPYGRIFNNTIYGGRVAQGTGVRVEHNAAPTVINNLFANLETGVFVDGTSVADDQGNARTIVGYSAFHGVGAEVVSQGSTPVVATSSLTLSTDPFVAAERRNFYPDAQSRAIDSSIDVLQDRNEFVVVNNVVGIPESPIQTPDLDIYGQKRSDDPSVSPSGSGLGLNVFKDRGAVDRVDFDAPTARLVVPLDGAEVASRDWNEDEHRVELRGVDALGRRQFVIQLDDVGSGVEKSTVNESGFRVYYANVPGAALGDMTLLTEGVDYLYRYLETTNQVIFESAAVFPLGEYRIVANNAAEVETLAVGVAATVTAIDDETGAVTLDTAAFNGRITDSILWVNGVVRDAVFVTINADGSVLFAGGNDPVEMEFVVGDVLGFQPRDEDFEPVAVEASSLLVGPILPAERGFLTGSAVTIVKQDGTEVATDATVIEVLPGVHGDVLRLSGAVTWDGFHDIRLRSPIAAIGDLAGNPLLNNNVEGDGTTAFTIALAAKPSRPVVTVAADEGEVTLTWTVFSNGSPIEGYDVEMRLNEQGENYERLPPLPAEQVEARSVTIMNLDSDKSYFFRVRARNGLAGTEGVGEWTEVGPIIPIRMPTVSLVQDTGNAGDFITTDDRVSVGNLIEGATWEYSTDSGVTWNPGNDGEPWDAGDAAGFELGEQAYIADSVQVRQTINGQLSAIGSNQQVWVIDQAAPNPPVITSVFDDVGFITGPVANGGVTDDTRPRIRGTAEPGSTVEVRAGDTLLGAAVTSANGSWEFDVPQDKALGVANEVRAYELTASARDVAGNQSGVSAGYTARIDRTASQVEIKSVTDDQGRPVDPNGLTNDRTPTVTGTAPPNSVVTLKATPEGGVSRIAAIVVSDSIGAWTVTASALGDGVIDLRAEVTDSVGRTGASADYRITIDTTAPIVPVIDRAVDDVGSQRGDVQNGGTTDDSTPELRGAAEPGSTINMVITLPTGQRVVSPTRATANGSGWSWTPETQLGTIGTHVFRAIATDGAGNASPVSNEFRLVLSGDPSPQPNSPTITAVVPSGTALANNSTTTSRTLVLGGRAPANSQVTVRNGSAIIGVVPADEAGVWSFTVSNLNATTHQFSAAVNSQVSTLLTITVTGSTVGATPISVTGKWGPVPPSGGTTVYLDFSQAVSGVSMEVITIMYRGREVLLRGGSSLATEDNRRFVITLPGRLRTGSGSYEIILAHELIRSILDPSITLDPDDSRVTLPDAGMA
jgi:hypothetical protein